MAKILITGSSGFIGRYLACELQKEQHDIVHTYRHLVSGQLNEQQRCAVQQCFAIGNIDAQTQWQGALTNVDCVVHLAARVHVMQETETDPLAAFRAVNTDGTMNLAKQAVAAGVKRFVYLSTIKVNGEHSSGRAFFANDVANPQDPYAISKFEAEQQLLALGRESGLEVVIIRPPLVYGPGVKGNFRRLIRLVEKSVPLPLGAIKNARSLVGIQNLCSLIETCLFHPEAAGEVFLVSDGQDLSTSELFEHIAQALGKKSRLFYLPARVIKWLSILLGKKAEYQRLFSSLQLDITKNRQLLDWQPKVSIETGISGAVKKVEP